MSGRYAAGTDVSVDRSRSEIETLLERAGARQFGYLREEGQAVIAFRLAERSVRMTLPLPRRDERRFTETPSGKWMRSEKEARAAYEQAVRQAWRQLGLVVKAKLEAIGAGISTVEREFLPDMVLPDGRTVGESIAAPLAQAYAGGIVVPLLAEGR